MGFKLLKEAYDIKHIVCVCNEEKYKGRVICIGSAYVHDIIVISMDGKVLKRYEDGRTCGSMYSAFNAYESEDTAKAVVNAIINGQIIIN